jgi:hypothetical protein
MAYEGIPGDAEEAHYIATLMPETELKILPGDESSDFEGIADVIGTFIGVDRPIEMSSVLSTVRRTVLPCDVRTHSSPSSWARRRRVDPVPQVRRGIALPAYRR